jgi:hypothetical protein
MKKVNLELPNKTWKTIKTKYPNNSDMVEYDELTNDSKNFDTTIQGVITKRSGGISYSTLPTPNKDQFEAIFNDGVHHLLTVDSGSLRYSSGGGTESLVTSGYSSLSNMEFAINQDRVYFSNGIDAPQVYDRTTTYGGQSYTAPITKVMGAQAPLTVPSGSIAAGGSIPVGGHTYKITYLYYGLEESNGGTATGTITTTGGNQTINLTSLPIGGYGVTARKIYRDAVDGVYLLVGTIADNTTTTFSDTASTGTAPIPTDHNVPPSFKYIVSHLDRNWIAGIPGDPFAVYFSEAGLPNVFPTRNRLPCNPSDPITGLFIYNDKPWIMNRNSLGSILGTTSDTFRYSALPSSVGCVDNRSIQIRTTEGIPMMVWLSSKGVYGTNGSSVTYLSDPIEDLVNLNIQQASQVKGQNAQTSQSQFLGGVASPGIDLTSSPGTITTPNPKRLWDTEAEWDGGSSLSNVTTHDGTNTIECVTNFNPDYSTGTHSNTHQSGSNVVLSTTADFTGENHAPDTNGVESIPSTGLAFYAQPIVTARNGTITSISVRVPGVDFSAHSTFRLRVWSAGANPGSVLYVGGYRANPTGSDGYFTDSVSIPVTAGSIMWVGVEQNVFLPGTINAYIGSDSFLYNNGSRKARMSGDGSTWRDLDAPGNLNPVANGTNSLLISYVFSQAPYSNSGIWTSQTYDTYADNAVAASIIHTGSFPASTSSITTIDASNDSTMSTGVITQSVSSVNGTATISLSGKRYWRIKIQLITTDDRVSPTIGQPNLTFATTATWISETIDHTTDITALNTLSIAATTPSGTSATVSIATSADDITYTTFGPIGSAVVQRYSKVKVVITSTSDNVTSANVQNVMLTWTLVANLQSLHIDTGNTPAGWDLFQAQFTTNGGTVAFYMRTATTDGGLASASYVSVTNGQFPTNTVLRYAQWKVVITSMADTTPTVDSVTVNWFISVVSSIRVASLFYNRAYYLAAAEYNQSYNNLIIVWDGEGNWRKYRDINVNTLGYFFNEPYYGSSTEGRIVKFLQSNTDLGTPIEMILDTKSIEFEDADHTKILRKLYLRGHNTGAAYTVSYSLDGGETFYLMIDEATGLTTFTSSTSGTHFYRRFIPNFVPGTPTAGKQILFRIREASAAPVSFEGFKAEVWIRSGEVIESADIP